MNLITNVFRLVHFRARHHKILRGFGHRDRIILKVLLESACSTRRVTCFLRVLYAGALQNHDIMEMVALHQIPNLERRRVQPLIFFLWAKVILGVKRCGLVRQLRLSEARAKRQNRMDMCPACVSCQRLWIRSIFLAIAPVSFTSCMSASMLSSPSPSSLSSSSPHQTIFARPLTTSHGELVCVQHPSCSLPLPFHLHLSTSPSLFSPSLLFSRSLSPPLRLHTCILFGFAGCIDK